MPNDVSMSPIPVYWRLESQVASKVPSQWSGLHIVSKSSKYIRDHLLTISHESSMNLMVRSRDLYPRIEFAGAVRLVH